MISLPGHVLRLICLIILAEEKDKTKENFYMNKRDFLSLEKQLLQLMFLDEVDATNQLVEACKFYISSCSSHN